MPGWAGATSVAGVSDPTYEPQPEPEPEPRAVTGAGTTPSPDWPDVLPGAFAVTQKKAPFAAALVVIVVAVVVAAAVASSAGTGVRVALMALTALLALVGVSVLFRLLQAGKPQLEADAVGIKTTLTPRRVPWERIERVRLLPTRTGGTRIGVVPVSIDEALGARMNVDRLIKILESRQQRDGAPFVASLATTGISADEARARLTELAAGRAPITD